MSICINQVKFKELSSFGYLFKYYKIWLWSYGWNEQRMRYVSYNQDRVWVGLYLTQIGKTLPIFISLIWGNVPIGSRASNRASFLAQQILNKRVTSIIQVLGTKSGRVSRVKFFTPITWRVQIGCLFHL